MQASRFLKTNLRKLVDGDYLFIDTDTIICDKLDSIDQIDADIALVADCNRNLMLDESAVVERCKNAGFTNIEGQPYFNSGVMFVRDTPTSHEFYEEWYRQWLYSSNKGIYLDQPSMNYSNIQLGYPIKELSGVWNCQIYFNGWNFLSRSKILHYAGGGKQERFDLLYANVRENGLENKYMKDFFYRPRIRLYAYLTNILSNKKAMLVLYLHVYFNWFTKSFFTVYGK